MSEWEDRKVWINSKGVIEAPTGSCNETQIALLTQFSSGGTVTCIKPANEDDRTERQKGIGMSKAKRKKDRIENADRHLMEEYDRCIALLDEAWSSMHEIRGLKEIIRMSMDGMDVPFSQTHWNEMMSALMIELTGDRENWRRRLEGRR